MIILVLLVLLVVLFVITNKGNENFINLDNNKDIKIIKPGDSKFNFYEYEFNFSNYLTVSNNYLITAKSNLAELGHIYNEGVIMIIHDDIIYLKNSKNEWFFLSKDNPYNLYFWEPIVKDSDTQKLNSII